ncbi:GRASP55/65 PDZ-like domain-containing protein [Scheffersomyces coipomensis]|uniref:GRASP55/65 PDZ-like domain-containing protein n=1 Tax=Scheffersomyces coipomensis TaxID=1788519 RepID=UPI00315CA6B3
MFSFAKKLVDRLDGSASDSKAADSYFKSALQLNNNGYGLRVVQVVPHSVAHQHGFEAWFDYIVRINNHELPMLNPSLSTYSYNINEDGSISYGGGATQGQVGAINYDLLLQEIKTIFNTEKQLVLDVWSAKGGIIRQIVLPLTDFKESTNVYDENTIKLFDNNFSALGLTLESQHLTTSTYVWRILTTHQGSPAFSSQLIPHSDYIIGCDSAFPNDTDGKGLLAQGGEALLSRTVVNYYNQHYSSAQEDNVPITLYVYNHDYDILRPVTVNLTRSWGTGQNKGILGCDVGYGLLHRIPEVIGKFDKVSIVDDLLFESSQTFGYEIPSSTPTPNPIDSEKVVNPIAPPPISASIPHRPAAAPKKKKHVVAAADALGGLNDYMNEELAKSKELDTSLPASSGHGTPPPPPPPTASK